VKITFLGTGSSTPRPKQVNKPFRSYSGTLIETGSATLLFDIGPGTVHKLLELGIDILQKPTHVFLSHYHLDHCMDIIALMKARGLHYEYTGEKNVLRLYGPDGLKEMLQQLFSGVEKWNYMTHEWNSFDLMDLQETMHGTVEENEQFRVSCTEITHYGGVAYRLDAEEKTLVYSGDMGYDENFSKLGMDADLAIVECSYPDRESLKGLHLCPEDIARLAALGNFKQTALTHMYPSCEGREDEMKKYIESHSPTKVTITEDFLTMHL
jgi:ribonuclease BN (tRNA processing enzyme)